MISQKDDPALCIDIGGSRIKAAVLSAAMSLEELRKISTIVLDSEAWLNEKLPLLLCANTEGSLRQQVSTPFKHVCIGVNGPVKEGRLYFSPKANVPKELQKNFEDVVRCPVFLECDAGIWGHGIIHWQNLTHQRISYPCLSISLGTGVSIAFLHSPSDVANIELSALDAPLARLKAVARCQPMHVEYFQPTPHNMLGKGFFDWVRKECDYYDEHILRKEFTRRVVALLEDLREYFLENLGVHIQSFAIGGGNSRWIMPRFLSEVLKTPLILLTPQNVSSFGVSPDLISLLGSSLLPTVSPVKMIPAWENVPWD